MVTKSEMIKRAKRIYEEYEEFGTALMVNGKEINTMDDLIEVFKQDFTDEEINDIRGVKGV